MNEDEASEVLAAAGLSINAPFILHVGGNLWYKNRSGVVAIFRHLMDVSGFGNHELVLAGPRLSPALQRELDPIADHVHHVVDPSARLLNALYSRAAALLFPSLQEGFGWPIVEAQSCGCPVITTDREPMLEVGGAAAFYIDPSDPKAAAEKIATGWSSISSRRAASIENAGRFSETLIARQYLQLYNRVQEQLLVDSR
jgi:glycosyltransferase involved in cell wall biosynthesis